MNSTNKMHQALVETDQFFDQTYQQSRITPHPNRTSLDLISEQVEMSNPASVWNPPSTRTQLNHAHQDIQAKICERWDLFQKDQILEIGCGTLNPDGFSHISSCMPGSMQSKFTYSDLNSSVNSHKNPRFIAANLSQLTKSIQNKQFDAVIASCAMDTVGSNKLTAAVKEVAKLLSPGGLFISLSDQYPFFNTICDHFSKKGMILFPLLNEGKQFQGLQVATRDQIENFLQKSSLPSDDKKFIAWYLNLSMPRREELINDICLTSEPKKVELSCCLSNWMSMQNIEGAQIIDNEEFYHQNLRTALDEAKLKIRKFKNMSSSFIEKSNSKISFYGFLNGHLYTGQNYVVAPGHTYFMLKVHVVIAQKDQ